MSFSSVVTFELLLLASLSETETEAVPKRLVNAQIPCAEADLAADFPFVTAEPLPYVRLRK